MEISRLAPVESRFADIVWEHAPMSTKDLVAICAQELNWARTTTYTVLKKFCLRGIFEMKNGWITVLITKEEFNAIASKAFVDSTFSGSLPAFIAAFASRRDLTEKELSEIRKMIDSMDKT